MTLRDFVYRPPARPYLPLLYVDDHIVVINKPSGLLSVPGKEKAHLDSAWYRASRVFPSVSVVHRLDMATSGVLVLARNKAAHKHLSYQFANRITHKRYYARLFGEPDADKGIMNIPLIVDYPNRPLQKVDWENGKPSLTCYKVIQPEPFGMLVELHPITGRSHQLRVHMRELGTPILGDRLYSPVESVKAVTRLQLHAQTINFVHPLTGKRISFSAPIPFSQYSPLCLKETYTEAKEMLIQHDIEISDFIE
ncbi:RNA pseudouridine synthase [Alteromonas sp. 5E99-2]|uniref:pseudouridine synthase n=1 Tax=Alteromonas sp. 5E99-2 TaxID=2817683 RepID=UPI001A99A0F0|nr:pseudouridine synthase [Alteromonas sp. 5E99-2]MBO1256644.1 RNA pseudouridine synthase [Alteromonas sp. 5E99-2]